MVKLGMGIYTKRKELKKIEKKRIKRKKCLLVVFLLLLLTICSCNINSNDIKLPEYTANQNNYNFSYEGNTSYRNLEMIRFFVKAAQKDRMSINEETDWADYIKKAFNVTVDIEYANEQYFDINAFNNVDNQGLLVYENIYDTSAYSKCDYLCNLKDLLDLNKYPSDVVKLITTKEGDVWTIPTYHDSIPLYRTYDADLLEALDAKVPTNIDEFYQLSQLIKEYNSRNNEKIYIATFTNKNILDAFVDVFLAYGCFIDQNLLSNKFSCISYNPLNEKFENIVDYDGLEDAILFIKNLYDDGLIYYNKENRKDIKVASYYGKNNSVNFDNIDIGLYLEGTSENQIIFCQDTVGSISILKNTPNVEELVAFFERTIFPDKNAQLLFEYGIEGKGYYIDHDILYINNENTYHKPNIRMSWYTDFNEVKTYINNEISEDINDNHLKTVFNDIVKNKGDVVLYKSNLYFDEISYSNYEKSQELYEQVSDANFLLLRTIVNILMCDNDVGTSLNQLRDMMENTVDFKTINEFIK